MPQRCCGNCLLTLGFQFIQSEFSMSCSKANECFQATRDVVLWPVFFILTQCLVKLYNELYSFACQRWLYAALGLVYVLFEKTAGKDFIFGHYCIGELNAAGSNENLCNKTLRRLIYTQVLPQARPAPWQHQPLGGHEQCFHFFLQGIRCGANMMSTSNVICNLAIVFFVRNIEDDER